MNDYSERGDDDRRLRGAQAPSGVSTQEIVQNSGR
jgi:hypothetical protein